MQNRFPYNEPSINNSIDRTAADRMVEAAGCSRTATGSTAPCGTVAGDNVLSRAGVKFTTDITTPPTPTAARLRVPVVLWWDNRA